MSLTDSEIIEIQSLKEVVGHLSNNLDALGVFDIDQVLTLPDNEAFQTPNIQAHRSKLQELSKKWSKEEKNLIANLIMRGSTSTLIEPDTPKIIENLQKQNIKLVALTATIIGDLGHSTDVANWRIEELLRLGIDFSKAFSSIDNIHFDYLPSDFNSYPRYGRGILFTNGISNPKSIVLEAFLREVKHYPPMIIFIDDQLHNLHDMQQALKKTSIDFIGFHYVGASNFKTSLIEEEKLLAHWEMLSLVAKKILEEKK